MRRIAAGTAAIRASWWPPLVLAAALLAGWCTSGGAAEPEVRAWHGDGFSVTDHLAPGAWTLVMFWSVSCAICAAEAPGLSAFHEQERARGVEVLGVSIDGAAMQPRVTRWMRDHQMRFPTLLGALAPLAAWFSDATGEPFRGTPTFVLFDPDRRLVGVNAGPVRVQAVREFIARKRRE